MFNSLRDFINHLGGYRVVAGRVSMRPTTLHTHMSNGCLPARWYRVFCDLAEREGVEHPKVSFFSFEPVSDVVKKGA